MTCKLTMALLSESQEGNVGEDWKYVVAVKVFHEGLKGEDSISVPKHKLFTGVTAEPHGSPEPVVVFDGECRDELLIKLHLTATEVDLFQNDTGTASMEFRMECPGTGGGALSRELNIAAGVRESPGILNKNAVFTVKLRFDLECG